MQTYTSNYGSTPQGQALASGQPNATNSTPPPGSSASSFPSDAALNTSFATANANNVNLALPGTRQGFINNSPIPGEQSNYDDLARQLFEYDTGVLNPKFAGTNPGLPGDAASFGRVDASPLAMTVGSSGLPASQGLSTATINPKYAYDAQSTQADSLSNLLDVLNRGISGSFDTTKSAYTSKVDAAQKALDTIVKLMSLKQDAIDKAAARASSGGLAGQKLTEAKNRLMADAKKGVTFTDLVLRYTPDGLSPSEIRDAYNQVNYYKKPASETESDVLQVIQNGKKSATPALTAERQKLQNNAKSALTDINKVSQLSQDPTQLLLAEIPGGLGARDYLAARNNVMDTIARLRTGSAMNKSEEALYQRFLPQLGDDKNTINNKIVRLKNYMNSFAGGKEVMGTDPTSYDGGQANQASANRPQIVKNLKSSGFNDNQIHEYLRRKGIDK
jgi:hypothetical protein